jgi:ubiquinone/menaquinone biosynthesis C-methylase UbiE
LPDNLISTDDAIRRLRADPAYAGLVRDAYLGTDVDDSCRRFLASGEFAEVRRFLGRYIEGASVLDLGAGTGIASAAFCAVGAARVVAVEPDPSAEAGRGAMARLQERKFEAVDGVGENIPLPDASMDIVYCRQVLHHARDLDLVLQECARVLKPNGVLFACREHVVDDDRQLDEFLAAHPMHQMAGGENAHSLSEYLQAIQGAGLVVDQLLGPLDSVINAFPMVQTQGELDALPAQKLAHKFGLLGCAASHVPGATRLVRARMDRPIPGRMYSFLAHRPTEPAVRQ